MADTFELRLQVKVSDAAVYRDDEFGQLQGPLLLQQMHDAVWTCVTGQSDVLSSKQHHHHNNLY